MHDQTILTLVASSDLQTVTLIRHTEGKVLIINKIPRLQVTKFRFETEIISYNTEHLLARLDARKLTSYVVLCVGCHLAIENSEAPCLFKANNVMTSREIM